MDTATRAVSRGCPRKCEPALFPVRDDGATRPHLFCDSRLAVASFGPRKGPCFLRLGADADSSAGPARLPLSSALEMKRACIAASPCFIWWPGRESNPRHGDFQSPALPTELPSQFCLLLRPGGAGRAA